MKLILFIGHHKVGSTSLQAALARDCRALLRRGVLYPAVESAGLAMLAGFASGRIGLRARLSYPVPLNYREGHNALAFRMWSPKGVPEFHHPLPDKAEMFRTITAQIDAFRPHTVILAAEVFSNFGARGTGLIRELLGALPRFDTVHVIATLRPVDDYLVSWYGQRLKFGTILKPLSATVPRHYLKGVHFNYRLMLEPWREVLPEARFTIQTYAEVLAQGGSVRNFFKQTGLRAPLRLGQKINKSVHPALIEFIRRANITLSPPDAQQFREIAAAPDLAAGLTPRGEIEMFGPLARANMLRLFEPQQDWLSKITGCDAFFPDVRHLGQCRNVPEHDTWAEVRRRLLSLPAIRDHPGLSTFAKDIVLTPHFTP